MSLETARHKMMIDKLHEQVESGWIDSSCWEYEFILSVREHLKMGMTLSVKQGNKLEELFDKY